MNAEVNDWFEESDDPEIERLIMEVDHQREVALMRRRRLRNTRRALEEWEDRRRMQKFYDDVV